jgi:hypothetical protein
LAIAAGGSQKPEAIEGQCEKVKKPLKLVGDNKKSNAAGGVTSADTWYAPAHRSSFSENSAV